MPSVRKTRAAEQGCQCPSCLLVWATILNVKSTARQYPYLCLLKPLMFIMRQTGREDFPAFPYEPYNVQREFMQHVYSVLQKGGIGLLESPTGTGKTLSLICSTLQWLQDKRAAEVQKAEAVSSSQGQDADMGLPDWMRDHSAEQHSEQRARREAQRAERLQKAKLKLQKNRGAFGALHPTSETAARGAKDLASSGSRPPGDTRDLQGISKEDAEFLLDEWDSEGEESGSKRKATRSTASSSDEDGTDQEDEEEAPQKTQVYFCSRTHSQLSQFVSELHRTPFASGFSVATVASRKALCINDSVLRLGNATRINEKCLELQSSKEQKKAVTIEEGKTKASAKGQSGCPFRKANMTTQRQLKDTVLVMPMDVEDLARLGRRKEVCPYYATRAALPEADLVLLPYPALLFEETRESLRVRLEGNIVVVDEAHNLVDAVNNVHSAVISAEQLSTVLSALDNYHQRFRSLLAPGNSKHIQTLICLAATLQRCLKQSTGTAKLQTVNDFLFSLGLDNINFFRLIRYVEESKVLVKIAGYADAANAKAMEQVIPIQPQSPGSGMSSLHALIGLASALNNADCDGRIIVDTAALTIKFILLNAAAHFAKVLASAHAVVLASGTLAPVASLRQQLFPGVPPTDLHHFTCGHVVPKERLLAVALGQGPTGATLDLRHKRRAQPSSMDEVGRLLLNICQAVPQGVVAFFPSFPYADQVYAHWHSSGALAALSSRKHVFREPRSSVEVESVLRQYAEAAEGTAATFNAGSNQGKRPTGALLLCIVGGKMSEGINFADGMGRCVVMVGMPFPNPSDPELCERMRFMDTCAARNPPAVTTEGKAQGNGTVQAAALSPGRNYLEDLCMKAVNQCIGRVIRHRNDWAAIVLADMRWTAGGAHSPLRKLPGWIQESLVVSTGFGDAYAHIGRFVHSI